MRWHGLLPHTARVILDCVPHFPAETQKSNGISANSSPAQSTFWKIKIYAVYSSSRTFFLSRIEPLPRTMILQPVSCSNCLAVIPRGPRIRPTKLNCKNENRNNLLITINWSQRFRYSIGIGHGMILSSGPEFLSNYFIICWMILLTEFSWINENENI